MTRRKIFYFAKTRLLLVNTGGLHIYIYIYMCVLVAMYPCVYVLHYNQSQILKTDHYIK